MEERVTIQGEFSLEGRYFEGRRKAGWVVCHPHPQFGGSMTNNVVMALCRAFEETGFHYLRFNFRGVGASKGTYNGGEGEVYDVKAAFEFMRSRKLKAGIAGYSFGAWVGCSALFHVEEAVGYVGVAPPVRIFSFPDVKRVNIPLMLICGEKDFFAPPSSVKRWVGSVPDACVVSISGTDHLFWGVESMLIEKVVDYLDKHFSHL